MKQFSLFTALLGFAIVGLAISLVVTQTKLNALGAEFDEFKKNSVSNERFGEALVDQEIGISFVLKLLDDRESNLHALDFIATIDGGMRFTCHNLPLYDDLAVYEYYETNRTFARGVRDDYEAKSICFLVDRKSETVIDTFFVNGNLRGVVWANLRDTEYEQYFETTDTAGVETQYVVRRNGFYLLDENTVLQQGVVHTKEWLRILESKSPTGWDDKAWVSAKLEENRKILKELKDGTRIKRPR